MGEWQFSCSCSRERFDGPGTLTLEADAHEKAREAGWVVDWDEYPGVACSRVCWQRSHDEWERSRPRREAAHAESRSERVGLPCDACICELHRAGTAHTFGDPGCVFADHHCDACHARGQCNASACASARAS